MGRLDGGAVKVHESDFGGPIKTGEGCCKSWTVSCEGCPAWSSATALPVSGAWMVEDGILMMGGAELERAAPVLSLADRGFGERNLANTFLRLDSGFNEESLGWFDIVDEMEVGKEDEACCFYS